MNITLFDSNDIVIAKCTSMVVLGGAAFVTTLIPVYVSKRFSSIAQNNRENSGYLLSLFLAFGGGVLLCTTFLHLLPDVSESITKLESTGRISRKYPLPLPEFIMCCGFFTMYLVEELVHQCLYSHNNKSHDNSKKDFKKNSSGSSLHCPPVSHKPVTGEGFEENEEVIVANRCTQLTHSETLRVGVENLRNLDELPEQGDSPFYDHQNHEHHHALVTAEPPSIRQFLIVLALTTHEGFEGLAVGLQTDAKSVWYLLIAVAVHKCVIAFCIGVELVSSHSSMALAILYAAIYSIASPSGIAVGLALTEDSANKVVAVLSVVLQGMATGTLLYVVFFEILKKNEKSDGGLMQMFVVLLGFLTMTLITALIAA